MPIGTSDGQTFDDEWQYATSALNDAMSSSEKMKFFDNRNDIEKLTDEEGVDLLQNRYIGDVPTIASDSSMFGFEKPSVRELKDQQYRMETTQEMRDHIRDEDSSSLDEFSVKPQEIADKPSYSLDNFNTASDKMKLNDQEKFLYQMHLNNLYSDGGVDNPDGSRSSLFQSVEEHNGKFYNIPTVWNGKIETEDYTNSKGEVVKIPNDTALDNVNKIGWGKFPSYATPEEADKRYMEMHNYMDKDTEEYFKSKTKEEPQSSLDKFYDKLSETWPAETVKTLKKAFMLSGRVMNGEIAPDSDEAINTAAEFALAFGTGGLESAGKEALKDTVKKTAKDTVTSPLDTGKIKRIAELSL